VCVLGGRGGGKGRWLGGGGVSGLNRIGSVFLFCQWRGRWSGGGVFGRTCSSYDDIHTPISMYIHSYFHVHIHTFAPPCRHTYIFPSSYDGNM